MALQLPPADNENADESRSVRSVMSSWSTHSAALHYATTHSCTLVDLEQDEFPALGCLFQVFMLFLALCTFTLGPLLVNWSVVVDVPLEAEAIRFTSPARKQANKWYGLTLTYQPGTTTLYAESVSRDGLAYVAGVLPGDILSHGEQAGVTVFNQSCFENQACLLEVQGFIGSPPTKSYPQADPPLLDPTHSLTVTFDMEHVDVKKGEPYNAYAMMLIRNVIGSAVLLIIYITCCNGSLVKLYTLRNVVILLIPSIGWTLADIYEVLANGKTNAVLYSVLSQSRLVGTALLMRVLLGTRQSFPQMNCLVSVTLLILCYIQVPDIVSIRKYWNGFGAPYDPDEQVLETADNAGVLYAFIKIGLSISMGVVGQKALQSEELKNLPLIGLQGLVYSVSIIPIIPLMLLYNYSVNWEKGTFGGYPIEFRHCLKSWDKATCNSQPPVLVEQGWDSRTVIVLCFYIYREFTLNGVRRIFGALTSNLVNTSATIPTYLLSVTMLGKQFNFTKCGMILCIMLQIIHYPFAPTVDEIAQSSERRDG